MCTTGLQIEVKENIRREVRFMGGSFDGNLTAKVTHLVAETVLSQKCAPARPQSAAVVHRAHNDDSARDSADATLEHSAVRRPGGTVPTSQVPGCDAAAEDSGSGAALVGASLLGGAQKRLPQPR